MFVTGDRVRCRIPQAINDVGVVARVNADDLGNPLVTVRLDDGSLMLYRTYELSLEPAAPALNDPR